MCVCFCAWRTANWVLILGHRVLGVLGVGRGVSGSQFLGFEFRICFFLGGGGVIFVLEFRDFDCGCVVSHSALHHIIIVIVIAVSVVTTIAAVIIIAIIIAATTVVTLLPSLVAANGLGAIGMQHLAPSLLHLTALQQLHLDGKSALMLRLK